MKHDFITIGGTTRDIAFFTSEGIFVKNPKDVLRQELLAFEYGAKIKVNRFDYSFGGGAANSAVCLANLGFKVACISAIGGDENGKLILDNLKSFGVKTNLVQYKKDEGSGTSFVLIAPSGERIIFSQRGANNLLKLDKKDLKEIDVSRNVYIASLTGAWYENLQKIFSVAEDNGQKVFWNPGMTQLLSGYKRIGRFIKKVTVLALNKDEALQLLSSSKQLNGYNEKALRNSENIAKAIHLLGPKITVITLGPKGVIIYDGKEIHKYKIKKERKRVDTTGIGDIFSSSFAAGYVMYNGNIDKAAHLALKNAALKVGSLGAQKGLLKMKKKDYDTRSFN